jgi:hypothetical protein
MDSKKLLFVIPVVSALVLAVAVGVVAFSSSRAAIGGAAVYFQKDEQTEALPLRHGFGGSRGKGHGGKFGFGSSFDYDAFLAEELGVTEEQLQDARQAAHEAALDQAVVEGVITEEQADLILAGQALRQYIDHQELLSQALGIDITELEAAREAGEPLRDLFGDLDPVDVKEALQSAYEDAVQQAIDDGVITESQAEQLQEKGFPGRGFGKQGGFHGHGEFPFQKPAPNSDSDL